MPLLEKPNPGSGERQLGVSGNSLGHTSIRVFMHYVRVFSDLTLGSGFRQVLRLSPGLATPLLGSYN